MMAINALQRVGDETAALLDPDEAVRMQRLDVFVVGLDDFHRRQLETLPRARECRLHGLFSPSEVKESPAAMRRLLNEGVRRLQNAPDGVDAVVGYWDFPVSLALPLMRQALGLSGPSLTSVLACEHKYWSRLEQSRVAPEHVPAFCPIDPFADDPLLQLTLDFPIWLKPIKSSVSCLGFRVDDREQFRRAIAATRRGIGRLASAFNLVFNRAEVPREVAVVDGYHCIAESLISAGAQCTLEGYVHRGEVYIYGTVDSHREGPAGSCFSRYQYPSELPGPVQARMANLARQIMSRIGYDEAPFNMEFYWDADGDRIWVLEINTRISKSHAPLFHLVDGRYHHEVMVALGLGRRPDMPQRQGRFGCAAKFMIRHYVDAVVTRVPLAAELAMIEARYPEVIVSVAVRRGTQLSKMQNQDSYSFELATVFVGADDRAALEAKFRQVCAELRFEFVAASDPRDPPGSRLEV